ncbi:MAG: ABC transporter transmembrane domain-containing protein [Pseudomonadota bacterium]
MDTALTPSLTLLNQLMSAAGWHSTENRLFEAVPHMSDRLSPRDMTKTLENLGVPTSSEFCRLNDITAEDCPSLFVGAQDQMRAVLDARDGKLLVSQEGVGRPEWIATSPLQGHLVRLERFGRERACTEQETFGKIAGSFRNLLPWLVFSSLMSNLAGLATPLLIMVIYDRVIPSGSIDLVTSLALVAVILLATDAGFRLIRSTAVAHMGRETEHRLGLALFRKLLALPVSQIQKASVEQQLARFKQFESLRDVFTGQVLTTALDLPFTLIFLAVLYMLSPQIALLILVLVVVFIILTCITLPMQKALNVKAAKEKSVLQSFVFETAENQRAIQRLGLVDYWDRRAAVLGEYSAVATRRATTFQLVTQNLGQSLMATAGLGAVVLGTLSAMQGAMTFGALIAVLSLVWKVLTPLQSLYANSAQIVAFQTSKTQSDRVLALPEEMVRGVGQSHQKTLRGRISVSGVTHRYDAASAPVLSQVSLEIDANEFVVIGGGSNSGKTTLLSLLNAFYQPSIGVIQIDGIDMRQIAVDDLRQSITYGLSQPEFFYGTVFQNFRLAAPSLSREEVLQALERIGLKSEIEGFPEGMDTRLSETFRAAQPLSVLRAMGLARALARGGSVCLLNEPCAGLDAKRTEMLVKALRQLKGERTFIIATQEPEIVKLADRLIYLQNGRVVANDVGKSGMKKFAALVNRSGAE